jgi:hypothetical protein
LAIINSILKIIILVDYANVRGKINGRINGIELEEIQIIANANPMPNESKSQVVIVNTKTGTYQLMITLLTPIFWLFTTDGDNERIKTINGFSLTGNQSFEFLVEFNQNLYLFYFLLRWYF